MSDTIVKIKFSEFRPIKEYLEASSVNLDELRSAVVAAEATRAETEFKLASAEQELMPVKAGHDAAECKSAKHLRGELETHIQALNGAKRVLEDAEKRIEGAKTHLPDGIIGVDRDLLGWALHWADDAPDEYSLDWPDESLPMIAAVMRGELDSPCDCDNGYVSLSSDEDLVSEIQLLLDDKVRHHWCAIRGRLDLDCILSAFDPQFRDQRLRTLKPWQRSSYSQKLQERLIAELPPTEEGIRSWIIAGPPGGGKTTLVSATLLDWLTWRAATLATRRIGEYGFRDGRVLRTTLPELNFWRINVPNWTADQERWEYRPFKRRRDPEWEYYHGSHEDADDEDYSEPSNSVRQIISATRTSGWAPIVWLEEFEKFTGTKKRLDRLHPLIDHVYSHGGTVIITTNYTLTELEMLIGEALMRRLDGRNDKPEGFRVAELFKLCGSQKSKPSKRC